MGCAIDPSVTTSLTDFSSQNPVFLEFIWIFSYKNHFKINIPHILNPSLTKCIPLNPAHQNLSNNTKGRFRFLRNFELRINLIFREEIIQYSKTFALQVQTSWNQAHAPLLVKSFSKTPKTGFHNYKTKQVVHCVMALPKVIWPNEYFIPKTNSLERKIKKSLRVF
jgi:hypothetical protein